MDYNEDGAVDTESDEEEDNEDESSGSDEDESGDDDGGGSDYESVEEIIETAPGAENEEGLRTFSSDDDPEKENCPICLNKFIGQDLGSPESCEHTFCFECIKEWSKNINTCPIDRTEFNYIHMKDSSDGVVLRKVEVKVAPKEPEGALEEIPTHCEICRSGDREDRLLLCDGCDLAYHCECLDPPLFYIPIEEWFCPACSGVLDRRAVAGPSRLGTRRIIPRTRASEAVRSRVQNIRSIRTPRSSSVSQSRKTSTQSTPKKRKRRYYRKAIRKVVTLARTKKDMNGCQKGKLGARTSTVIVTYRRRRRRRKTKRKVSKRSNASNKSIPSSKQRIAKHLGIAKTSQGSSATQIKTAAGSRSTSARLPSHSLFGNKNQLMDFNENFNEDMGDASSTTSSKSSNRSSVDPGPSTSSGLSILDSIIAGQKILHVKSDKILIKTDGSLILKENTKKQNSIKKIENNPPSRTPMSIALAKQGVRSSLSDKNLGASCKKHADTSKTKNISDKKNLKSLTTENRLSINEVSSESSSKLFKLLSSEKNNYSNNEKKSYLPTSKRNLEINTRKINASENDNAFTELDGFSSDTSSDIETTVTDSNKTLNVENKTKEINNIKSKNCSNSGKIYQTKINTSSYKLNDTMSSSSPTTSFKASTESFLKKEIVSDKELNNGSITANIENIHVKQEILSDEETNIDSWNKHTDNKEQEFNNKLITIKKEPIDPDLKVDTTKDRNSLEINRGTLLESNPENNLSDCDASQSIFTFVPLDSLKASEIDKVFKTSKLLKVKEELPSDTEDYSQSLILDASSQNLGSPPNLKKIIKKEPASSNDVKRPEKENVHHKKRPSFIERLESQSTTFSSDLSKNVHNLSDNELPCTQAVACLSNSESETDVLPCTQTFPQASLIESEDDEIPCAQPFSQITANDSEDEEIPCTQAFPQMIASDSEDEEIPCTQASLNVPASDSEDDEISCAQPSPHVHTSDSEDDEIPCAQPSSHVHASGSKNDEIPYAQSSLGTDSKNIDLPCTQASTQAEFVSTDTDSENDNDDDDLPCTQAAPIFPKNSNKKPSYFNSDKCDSRKISRNLLPPSLDTSKNKDAGGQVSRTKMDFEFKMPSAISTKKSVSDVNNNVSNKSSSKVSLTSTLSEYELPSTQDVASFVPISRSKSSSNLSNNLKSVKITNIKHSFDIDNDFSLPMTQISSSNSKQMPSKIEIAISETQNFKADSQSLFLSESFDLPPTQISNMDALTNTQIDDNEKGSILDTQVLPDTQIICPNSKKSDVGNANDEQDIMSKKNFTEIISNIKQLVNNLSSKVFENQNLQNSSIKISNNESSSNASNNTSSNLMDLSETVSSGNVSCEEKNVLSSNSKDALAECSKELSFISSENKNQNEVQSSDDSDPEEFSLEKLKASLQKSKVTPKKSGIHKHLPQVIATVPVKENLKIKRSNKRTFSFEEVKKLQGPSTQQKPSKNSSKSKITDNKIFKNCESDSDDSLPATQAFETLNDKQSKSSLLQHLDNNLAAKDHITNRELTKNHLNEKSDFQSISSSAQENDDFPATQAMVFESKEKDLYLCNKRKDLKSMNSNNSLQNTNCKVSNKKVLSRTEKESSINLSKKRSVPSKVDLCQNTDSTTDFIDLNDLPATQVCNNLISTNSSKVQKLSNIIAESSMNLSKKRSVSSKVDLCQNTNSTTDFIDLNDLPATQVVCNNQISTKSSKVKKLSNNSAEATSVEVNKSNAAKRKNSFNEITKNKRLCNQIRKPLDCENDLLPDIIHDLNGNCTRKKITIKQEKDDFQFVKPSANVQIFNSITQVSCLNQKVIKTEKVDTFEDFLPPTQAINFNLSDDNSLPQTQVTNTTLVEKSITEQNNLKSIQNCSSSCQIKKEPCSYDDDEVSVIELDTTSNVEIKKEVIFIDDDDESFNCNSNLLNLNAKQKEIPSKIIDATCIKNEKCSEAATLLKSPSDVESLSIIWDKSKISNSKISKDYKKKDNDSVITKPDCQNQKQLEPKKNKRNLTESDLSNKNVNNSEDLHTCKEKILRNSPEQHASEKKGKKNSKDHNVSEEKSIISNNTISETQNTTLKDFSQAKKRDSSKNTKPSRKEIKDPDKFLKAREKGRKELKDLSSSKEVINVQSVNSLDLKKNKDKISENSSVESISKSKKKVDKCESLLKKNSDAKCSEKSKDSSVKKDNLKLISDQYSKNIAVTDKVEKDTQKHFERQINSFSKQITLEDKLDHSSDKDSRCSSEKENRNKNGKEVVITLKPTNKRPHNDTSDKYNHKKRKLVHSLDSESNSSEDIALQLSDLPDDFYKFSNFNDIMEFDGISKRLSASKDIENTHRKTKELCSKPVQATDMKKVHSKQDLKEEIANEVKQVLKPFYNAGLISKEDYKDIMRRAVPKIFMNCHKLINPEKIRKLVLNYVSLLSNKS